jgi:hypothetical protein
MNLSAQEYLAKLLAKENLSVQHGNYSTASFDVLNRVLRLPLWKDKGKDVYDLLVGHEVGHALYTPVDGWHDSEKKIGKIPRAYLNIVEDIRIERKIQEAYPGIVRRFRNGYKRLFDDDLFGTNERDINKAGLMDRLNVSSKGRGYIPVEFSSEESPLVKEAMEVKTWDDVVVVCKKLFDFIEENKEEKEEDEDMEMGMPSDDGDSPDDSSGETPISGDEEGEDEGDDGESESEGDGKEEESKEGKVESEEEVPEGHETWTEDTHREREEDLLEKSPERQYEKSGQPQYTSGISEENMDKILYSYDFAKDCREKWLTENDRDADGYSPYKHRACLEDWSETKMTYKTQANLIAKDFERKKAAFEYSRSRTAKSGKLDPLKLHQYKTSEDIFLTTTQLAQAKSHGILMFLDLSGSMNEIIEDVTAQAITIAMFCRQVNIPFAAYSFTTTSYWRRTSTEEGMREIESKESEIESEGCKVVEMFSSKMNKKTFDEAAYMMFAVAKAHSYSRNQKYHISAHYMHAIDGMGSTPLIQTAMLAAKLTKEFTRKHAIQNTNIMFLTDGYPDGLHVKEDKNANVNTSREMIVNFNGKMIKGQGGRQIYKEVLLRLKELTGATIMGFHLAYDASTFGQGYCNVNEDRDFPDVIKDWRKAGFAAWKNCAGYDDFFIIKINRSARFDSDIFEPKKADTINDLKREFKKFSKTKKGNKQLVARITDAVAA